MTFENPFVVPLSSAQLSVQKHHRMHCNNTKIAAFANKIKKKGRQDFLCLPASLFFLLGLSEFLCAIVAYVSALVFCKIL